MSACFCPDHKAPMVLFLDRVYGIEDQSFLLQMLEVGFLPDLRASASLDTVSPEKPSSHIPNCPSPSTPILLYSSFQNICVRLAAVKCNIFIIVFYCYYISDCLCHLVTISVHTVKFRFLLCSLEVWQANNLRKHEHWSIPSTIRIKSCRVSELAEKH